MNWPFSKPENPVLDDPSKTLSTIVGVKLKKKIEISIVESNE
jgi:hypothetical protein